MADFTRRRFHSSRMARWAGGLLLAIAGLGLCGRADAQVLYGSLTGSVTDQTNAPAVGAKVQVLNVETNVARSATTGDRGAYTFGNLLPGVYEVTIEAPSFKTVIQKGVRIEANTVRRVDARLEIAAQTETIEVVASAAPLQTDRADVHVTQTAKQVNDLPLAGSLGRNYQSLMQVVPGAVIMRTEAGSGEANSTAGSPQRAISFSANGVSGWVNQTKIDGSPVTYIWLPTNTAYVPSPEAIEEVNVVTNSYSAEQGTAGGAAVNVIVKSGTNKFRGAAWGYDTDARFRARNAFQTTDKNPKNIVAQYGANLGGPIIKDKLFFFANVEKTTQRVGAGSRQLSIAPANLRPNANGDVVFPMPSEGGAIIYDPASSPDPSQRTPFPNNTIPASRVDQAALYLMQRLPATNTSGYTNNVVTTGATEYNRTNYDVKLNYAANSRLTMFARYGNSPHRIDDQYALGEAGGGSAVGGSVGLAVGRTQVLGVGATYTFSPTMMLDANFGWTHQVLGAEAPDLGVNVGSDPDKMNIPGTNGPDRMQGGLPSFQISGWSNLGNDGTGNPFQFRDNQYSFSLNLQKALGGHLFRLGGEFLNQQINHFQPQGGAFQTVRGTFTFSGQGTMLQGDPNAPKDSRFNSWAQFLLGDASTAGKVDQLLNPNSIHEKTWAAYLQDTWQVTRSLTVSLGLRWELYSWPTRPDGKGVSRFDPEDGYVYVGGYGDVPQDTYASVGKGQLLPRAGLIYRLNDKTVFRAGYGRSADPTTYINFRNSYPIVYIWAMPATKLNGSDNPYLPVTNFRQGLVAPPGSPNLNQGKIQLPAGVGTTTYRKDGDRGYIDSFNVDRAARADLVDDRPGRLRRDAGPQPVRLRQHQCRGPRHRHRRPCALRGGADELHDGHQLLPAVRGPDLQRPADGTARPLAPTPRRPSPTPGRRRPTTTTTAAATPPARAGRGSSTCRRRSATRAPPATTGRTTSRRTGPGTCRSARVERWAQGGIAGALLGGWQINGILSVMSGTPIYIVQNTGYNLNAAGSGQVPDLVKDIGGDLSRQQGQQAACRGRPERVPVLRPQRLPGGQHPRRRAAAFRHLAPQQHPGAGLLERRPGDLPHDLRQVGQPAAPRRSAQRVQPPELREPGQQRLGCQHLRVHHLDDGRRRAQHPLRSPPVLLDPPRAAGAPRGAPAVSTTRACDRGSGIE